MTFGGTTPSLTGIFLSSAHLIIRRLSSFWRFTPTGSADRLRLRRRRRKIIGFLKPSSRLPPENPANESGAAAFKFSGLPLEFRFNTFIRRSAPNNQSSSLRVPGTPPVYKNADLIEIGAVREEVLIFSFFENPRRLYR